MKQCPPPLGPWPPTPAQGGVVGWGGRGPMGPRGPAPSPQASFEALKVTFKGLRGAQHETPDRETYMKKYKKYEVKYAINHI